MPDCLLCMICSCTFFLTFCPQHQTSWKRAEPKDFIGSLNFVFTLVYVNKTSLISYCFLKQKLDLGLKRLANSAHVSVILKTELCVWTSVWFWPAGHQRICRSSVWQLEGDVITGQRSLQWSDISFFTANQPAHCTLTLLESHVSIRDDGSFISVWNAVGPWAAWKVNKELFRMENGERWAELPSGANNAFNLVFNRMS